MKTTFDIAADIAVLAAALDSLPDDCSPVVFTAAERLKEHSASLYRLPLERPATVPAVDRTPKCAGVPFDVVGHYRDAVGMLIAAATGGVSTIEEIQGGAIYDATARGIRESVHAVISAENRLPEL